MLKINLKNKKYYFYIFLKSILKSNYYYYLKKLQVLTIIVSTLKYEYVTEN